MASQRASPNENHTTSSASRKQRKRGIAAALRDATNLESLPSSKRQCNTASSATKKAKPRGRHVQKCVENGECLNQLLQNGTIVNTVNKCINAYIAYSTAVDMHKAFAIQVFTTAILKWNKGIVDASKMASDVVGYSERAIRSWTSSFFTSIAVHPGPVENIDHEFVKMELSSNRGSSIGNSAYIINDEDFQLQAREFVRKTSCIKGEPNLTSKDFQQWIESLFGVKVCEETARVWLQTLGFTPCSHKKGIFFDGHDRDDVVQSREKFVHDLAHYDEKTITPCPGRPQPELVQGEKPYIRVVHDESTFYANACQGSFWADEEMQILRQKSLGQAIMVSEFIVEGEGYLRDEQDEARLFLETQSEGYFNNDKFLQQVDKALDIFNRKYPDKTGLFMFDHAPCHKKTAEDATK